MTIENLKQIAIKYASTKGSRVPLAPDELCNAVVQYFNEFLKITADINTIQVAVTEEGGNIVFTITGNTLDGKAFTPIVITVDHNDFVTDQEFEAFKTTTNAAIQKNTESINSLSFRVEDTENDITTIQVQVGQINTRVGNTETDVTNLKNRVDNTETNTVDINTIQVAVTEEGGNIVFTITGNTLDGKAFTPIVITVDHNDFVTNQEFEEFKTSVTEQLNNKLNKITSPISNFVLYANIEGNDTQIRYASGPVTNSILYRDETGKTAVVKGVSGQDVANMENLSDITAKIPDVSGFATKEELKNVQNSLTNKRSVISSPTSSYVVYTQANGLESNLPYSELANQTSTNIMARRANGTSDVKKGISGENVANMENIADVESKIPDVSNFATTEDIPSYTDVGSVSYDITNGAIIAYDGAHEIHIPLLAGENVTIDASEDNKKIVISAAGGGGTGDVTAAGNNTFTGENTFTNEITFNTMKSEAGYIQFGNFNYETTEGYDYLYIDNTHINMQKFVGNNQYHEININADLMTYAPPDDNVYYEYRYPRKNGTFALTSDIPDTSSFVTLAGDNTFGGTNTFNNSIYAKNGVVAGDTTNYGANSVTKGSNTYSFPNKSGTFAMTTDIIKNPIYFISFYANDPSEPCHLIGTMMSKNSYGTGQKTNEEFAVMLADNLYVNSNEGLAVYGRLANKDILCIYSEDGLSIRCLDEENSEVDLPMVMFFVMETEL